MNQPMEFGASPLRISRRIPVQVVHFPAEQRIADIIGYAALAERLGLDLFALGEHHTPDFAVSSPAVVLASPASLPGSSRRLIGQVQVPSRAISMTVSYPEGSPASPGTAQPPVKVWL